MRGPPGPGIERRPLASRRLPIFGNVARRLASAGVSANAISAVGMLFGLAGGALPAAIPAVPGGERWMWLGAAAFVQLRLLANLLDGMVAIENGKSSPVGELWNEVPDRVSDTAILVGFGLAPGGALPWGLAAALASVWTAYVRAAVRVAGAPQDFGGPLAKPQRMALVTIACLYLGIVPDGWRPDLGGGAGLPAAVLVVITCGAAVTGLLRLARGARRLQADRTGAP